MDQSRPFNHGSESDQHLLFDDADANVFAFESGGVDSRDMAADDGHFRRDSMNSAALSPLSEPKWSDTHHSQAVDTSRRTSFALTNPFRDDYQSYRTSISASAPSSSSANIHHAASGWTYDHTPGTASPSAFEPYQLSGDDYDVTEYPGHLAGDVAGAVHHGAASVSFAPLPGEHGGAEPQPIQAPLSPHSNPDMMAIAAKDMHLRALPRHMRPGCRPARPGPSRASSDGVRKKNSRIEIPPDRNLNNIEELIEHANDDDEIKELKAQRRLLRNREAALASRQRKKQHTEDLEVKEQRYLKQINGLKNELAEMSLSNSRLENEYRVLHQKHAEACHVINAFNLEKEELIMKHTQETGNLRRKIQYLTEQIEDPNDQEYLMSTHTNFNEFTSDMNALSVNNQPWMSSVASNPGQFTTEPDTRHPATQGDVKLVKREPEQPIASGVLFMILLCGAFVASKGNNKPFVPSMPEEVRVASTTVLDNLLKDPRSDMLTAGMASTNMQHQHPPQISSPPQSHPHWPHHLQQQDSRHNLYRSLTMPTSHQEADHIFSLTPAEYNSLTSPESYTAYHPQPTVTPRRNLAETLANVRQESISKVPPAEVYTRSLLWDQIPADIVKQFKELVKESKANEDTGSTGEQLRQDSKVEHPGHNNNNWAFSVDHQ
ncbi:Transcriptional activator hacA [Sphaceloma murrayae]|uniref:Transcriptional activator hacA n=1 Tax=Sphaceloma murrayae TaxID=2082308 RepID=A0A2K1QU47_9PEZI|nr:Transcriptional activator hacA [Sphaceloma murrayae]